MKRNEIFNKLSLSLDLPAESAPGQSVVEMVGHSRVIVDNHCGLMAYSDSEICIKVKFGSIRICGTKLRIVKMSDHNLVICGCIDSILANKGA